MNLITTGTFAGPSLVGKTVARWTILAYAGYRIIANNAKYHYWLCRCDCGKERNVAHKPLLRGQTRSCGCLRNELAAMRNATHGMVDHPLYAKWAYMRDRSWRPGKHRDTCYCKNKITVCKRWDDFKLFLEDMGPSYSPGLTLERNNSKLGYSPENCRWATYKEQGNNTSQNRKITFNGITKNMTQWAEELGIGARTIWYRINHGWTIAEALSIPVKQRS